MGSARALYQAIVSHFRPLVCASAAGGRGVAVQPWGSGARGSACARKPRHEEAHSQGSPGTRKPRHEEARTQRSSPAGMVKLCICAFARSTQPKAWAILSPPLRE